VLNEYRQGAGYNTRSLGKTLKRLHGSSIGDRKLTSTKRLGQRAWRIERKGASTPSDGKGV